MNLIGIAKIFKDSTETGAVAKRSMTAKQVKHALAEVGYIKFFPHSNEADVHVVKRPGIEWRPNFSSPVEDYIPVHVRMDYEVPSIKGLVRDDLYYNTSAMKMFKLGFSAIAEAMKLQRDDQINPRIVQATLLTAGQAFSYGFEFLNGGKRGLEKNRINRSDAGNIASAIFDSALKHNPK